MVEVHPSLLVRKIIHVDMDAYYASIEVLDDPSLKGKPVVVGGRPDGRGVVCTASYEARRFGVRSAMAAARAKRLCPDAVFLRPRFERYVEVSKAIRAIMRRYASVIEPLSLDEAYLDVTANERGLYAVEIAKRIRAEIKGELGLTASAGVAPNKMLAKIASDLKKPDGLSVILPDQVATFVRTLPLGRIHGIGPVSARKLGDLGLHTCADVTARSRADVIALLGESYGDWVFRRSQGIDERPVQTSRERKSIGSETTFQKDLTAATDMRGAIAALAAEVGESLRARSLKAKTITIKARYPDFATVTRAMTLPESTDRDEALAAASESLLARTEAAGRGVRLLGVSVSKLVGAVESERAKVRTLFGD